MSQRFLVLEDHPMFREAISNILSRLADDQQIVTAATLREALGDTEQPAQFDLMVVDLSLPDSNGVATLRAMMARYPTVPAVVFSAHLDSGTILRCLEAGARGFLPKTMGADAVMNALRLVLSGETYVPPQAVQGFDSPRWARSHSPADGAGTCPRSLGLTDRQISVLKLILRGLPNKLICRNLNLAEGTIKVHVSAVLRVLGVRNRTQAIIAAREMGLRMDEGDDAVTGFTRPPPANRASYVVRPLV